MWRHISNSFWLDRAYDQTDATSKNDKHGRSNFWTVILQLPKLPRLPKEIYWNNSNKSNLGSWEILIKIFCILLHSHGNHYIIFSIYSLKTYTQNPKLILILKLGYRTVGSFWELGNWLYAVKITVNKKTAVWLIRYIL